MPYVEIFTPTGVVSGSSAQPDVSTDAQGSPSEMAVDGSRWYPLDGSRPDRRGNFNVASDDILIVVTAPPAFTVHAAWYPLELEVGPYRVSGRLPTPPGFDPGRAIARPSGAFVSLRDVRIELIDRPEAGVADRSFAHINRYAVDRVVSTLMLAFFFPGAEQEVVHDEDPVPATLGSTTAAAAAV